MNYKIALVPGDGIGPDVTEQTVLVMNKIGEKYGNTFAFSTVISAFFYE